MKLCNNLQPPVTLFNKGQQHANQLLFYNLHGRSTPDMAMQINQGIDATISGRQLPRSVNKTHRATQRALCKHIAELTGSSQSESRFNSASFSFSLVNSVGLITYSHYVT